MSFMVDGGVYRRPRYETVEEASKCASDYLKKTGIVLGVFEDSRPANAKYKN